MARIIRTTAILFLAASSVYPSHVNSANGQTARNLAAKSSETDVKLLDDATDPFGAVTPAKEESATQPTNAGQSVSTTQVNTSASGSVEIHVNEANILEVLRMLSLQSQKNIVASREVKGTVTANLYDVTVQEALAAILKQNNLISVEDGPVIYVYTRKEYQEVQKANRRTATEVFTLHYLPVVDAERMVKNLLSSEGKTVITAVAKNGVGFDNATAGGDDSAGSSLLVVTDYEDNLANVRKLMQEVDIRPTQVLVEATILRASLTEDNALGVDFTVLGGVDFSTVNTASGLITGAQAANPTLTPGGPSASSGGTGNNFTNGINNGLKLGFVNSNVAIFLSALEEATDTAVLANPKVLVLNKQKGEVKVVRKDPYRGAIVTDVNGQSRQEVETQETGTKLIFRPYIGNDGFIRLEIHPEDSTALPARAADLPPSQLSTEATTNVLVKDGRTIVIGGLFRESSSTTRSQIPMLGNIPVLGNLFRKKADNTVREEIIILLTPHIVKDDEAYSQLSKKEAEAADRVRVGVRRGMMPWGRERLAESAYENAVKEMAKPKPNKRLALWHLDCATNLNPKFLEAIDLKEKVSGKVVTSVDNSSIRSFVRDSVLNDAVASGPVIDSIDAALAANPTTQPLQLFTPDSTFDAVAAVPATQPTATEATAVEVPTVAEVPVAPATESVAEAPVAATETPAVVDLATVVTEAAVADPIGATAPVVELPPATVTITEIAESPTAPSEIQVTVIDATVKTDATTQPSFGEQPAFQVTELPTEDVK